MINLHPLIAGTPVFTDSFHKSIILLDADRKILNESRDDIRQALRTGLPALIKQRYPNIAKTPAPKFHTQGSCAYHTVIQPAHMPPQQSDMDDGCYLPLSFLKGAQPEIASQFFFEAVETVLYPLAKVKGWKINPTGKKPTCTRIEIDATKHIDLPLYAIPDLEYEQFVEAVAKSALGGILASDDRENAWALLPEDSLLLAHREDGWKLSDPRPIKDWVTRQVSLKTDQLRRVIRYIKAWRDWQWPHGKSPASILLMVAVDAAFDVPDSRDDLILLRIAERLPDILGGNVLNPVPPHENLSDKLDQDGIRGEVVSKAQILHSTLQAAIMVYERPEDSCLAMQRIFGPRFPANSTAIEKVMAASVVRSNPPRKIEREPLVGRSTAG